MTITFHFLQLLILPLCLTALVLVAYRLTLHPLSCFPGPKLAAATGLYEAYYQCLKDGGGRYWKEIEKMHREYGMCLQPTSKGCDAGSLD